MSFSTENSDDDVMNEINMTPLIDVMLVLVVILIVTAPLLASAIRLDLPAASAAQPAGAAKAVSVSLDSRGGLFLNDQPVTPAELAQRVGEQTLGERLQSELFFKALGRTI